MVDVSAKPDTNRVAVAEASILLSAEAFRRVRRNEIAKGDVLTVAKLAGIQAAKETSRLIPLCHPIPLDAIRLELTPVPASRTIRIVAEVATRGATGVEMEAMTAAAVAALAVYDMCKAVDRQSTIGGIRLMEKRGGRSGEWKRPTGRSAARAVRSRGSRARRA
jgi:cyclic pyranopterin phosphate synthase